MNKYIPLHREWLEGITPTQLWKFLLLMLLLVMLMVGLSSKGYPDGEARSHNNIGPCTERRAKCSYLWQRMAPWSYIPALCDYFVGEHERAGIGPEWSASICYGFANFGLTLRSAAPGRCYGPMDVKWPGYARQAGCRVPNDLLDPWKNIRAHVLEVKVGSDKGYSGVALCKYIMLPAAPTDWGCGRFRKTWAMMQSHLADYYCSAPK